MSKEVTNKKETQVASYNEADLTAWGDNDFSQSDIIIPKLVMMQPSSTLLSDNEALRSGDYIHSVTKELIGNAKKPVKIIPIHMKKLYRVTVKEGMDYKYSHMEEWNEANDSAPKEFMHNHIPALRQKAYQFYVLIDGFEIPFIVTMKGMSFGMGRRLANEMFLVNKMKKLPPPGRTFLLGVEDVEYEGKKYKGYAVTEDSITPASVVVGTALEWYKTINSGKAIEHSEAEVDATEGTFEEFNNQF